MQFFHKQSPQQALSQQNPPETLRTGLLCAAYPVQMDPVVLKEGNKIKSLDEIRILHGFNTEFISISEHSADMTRQRAVLNQETGSEGEAAVIL